jgi:hypothetical protein
LLISQPTDGQCILTLGKLAEKQSAGPILHLKWGAPWNLHFINTIHYEVWLQERYRAFRTEDPEIVITGDDLKAGEQYTVWVRGVTTKDKGMGPFSSMIVCKG